MMRVNLLPPEILERRSAEKRIGWVALGALALAVALAAVWGFASLRVQSREDDLAAIQQQVSTTQVAADQLAIFETRAAELDARRATAQEALAARVAWARLFDEMSLILPSDAWLQTIAATEDEGMQLAGYVVDAPSDNPDSGHSTIAKILVRLADLEQLRDVWLTSSTKDEFEEQPAIAFTVTSQVSAEPDGGDTP
jgi:Tfp pilus assembly protein PilN